MNYKLTYGSDRKQENTGYNSCQALTLTFTLRKNGKFE